MKKQNFITLALAMLIAFPLSALADWKMANVSIKTKFADDVSPTNALPEYPRPQMVRGDWMNLNGLWDFASLSSYGSDIPTTGYQQILVPYCVESALSGIKKHYEAMVYRRTFTVPAAWDGKRVLLNFEAVDWRCTVRVNGEVVGTHDGGYDPFSFDITDFIKGGEENEITVKVFDPTDRWSVPRGKQVRSPGGIFYTSCSGIWQTVWLEAVNPSYIQDFRIIPDIDAQTLTVNAVAGGNADNVSKIKATAYHGSKMVAEAEGMPGENIVLNITNPNLWTPDHPFLYDLKLEMVDKQGNVDEVKSYFGMRKIHIEKDKDGFYRMMLNNEFVFQTGPLDQGYWPESNLTPPTDEAMQFDIVMMKKYGFNMVRKHITVEPRRWYYWTDKLGLLVWQDMPSMNYGGHRDEGVIDDPALFTPELTAMVNTHFNSPSIINWVIFNEAGGQHDTKKYVDLVRSLDNTRLIDEASGWTHEGYGDIKDTHPYPAPSPVVTNKPQALANGEYGGVKLAIDGHLWDGTGWGYASVESPEAFDSTVCSYFNKLAYYKTYRGMSAAVYTQITDVEIEVNGIMTYDREVKSDISKIYRANRNLIERDGLEEKYVLPIASISPQSWHYTFNDPGTGWSKENFDDSKWQLGNSGFGSNGLANMVYGTNWSTSDIWARKVVDLNLTEEELKALRMMIYNDEDIQIYVNGVLAYSATGYLTDYKVVDFSSNARAALNPAGKNVFAIHVKQTAGGQFLDMGLTLGNTTQALVTNRIVQINMDYTKSSELSFTVGYSLDPNATEPDETQQFTRLTFADGEANYIGLNDGALLTPKTVQLDITDLTASIPEGSTIKYFIYVNPQANGDGAGTVHSCTVIDYTQDANGVQTPMTTEAVTVSHETGSVLLSASMRTEAFNAPRNAYIDNNSTLHWDAPLATTAKLQNYKVYANGICIATLTPNVKEQKISETADYTVVAIYSNGTSPQSNVALAPIKPEETTNIARHFKDGGFIVPDVFTTPQPNATIEYWFKPDALTANSHQVGSGWGSFLISYDQSGRVSAGFENTAGKRAQSTSNSVKANEWAHVAVTITGSRLYLYINGTLKGTANATNYKGLPAITEFTFGRSGALINGWIDDVRLWKSARTLAEVKADMNSEIINPGAESDLLAYYKMDEIVENGTAKLRDHAKGHHAPYINADGVTQAEETGILNSTDIPAGVADFAFADSVVIAGSEILAETKLNGSVVSWEWTEPVTGTKKENLTTASFVFPKAGTYEVTLTAYEANGNAVDTTKSITVLPVDMPVADFDIYQPSLAAGTTISLINKSAGVNTTYKWNMPGSTTEQNQEGFNASASYSKNGTYQITLTATNPAGSATKTKSIEVSSEQRNTAFTVSPNVILPRQTTALIEKSGADSANLVWTVYNDKNRTLILGGTTAFTPTAVGRYDISLTDSETGSTTTVPSALYVCSAPSKTGLFFRNAGESLTIPSAITEKTSKFTVEWWMNPSMALNAGAMATKNGIFSVATDGTGRMTAQVNGKTVTSPEKFVIANEWHHYAVVLTSSRLYLMRDGQAIANAYPILSTPAWDELVVGGADASMSANIDEMRIWGTGFKEDNIATICNAPISDIADAQSSNALKVYYNFDEMATSAKDLTTNKLDGTLDGFREQAAANFVQSGGVFSLSINTESTIGEPEDITAQHLTNYKSEFLHTTDDVNSKYPERYYGIETGTKNSTWEGATLPNEENGVFVDTKNGGQLTYTTTWEGFPQDGVNKPLYQTITLPAGMYRLSAVSTTLDNTNDCMLVATLGNKLASLGELSTTLGAASLDGGSLDFTVPYETEVSVGVLYNLPAYSSSTIESFSLSRLSCEVIPANSNFPTGIKDTNSSTDNLKVSTSKGKLTIEGNGVPVQVYTIDSRLVMSFRANGKTSISLPAGIYIINNNKVKVQ